MLTTIKKVFSRIQDRKARLRERALLETLYQNDTVSLKNILKNEVGCVMKMVRGAKKSRPLPLYVFMAGGRANGQISQGTENILNDALLHYLAYISNNVEEALCTFEKQLSLTTENSNEIIEIFVQPWKKYFIESKTQVALNDVRALSSSIYERLPMAIEDEKLKRTTEAAGYAGFLF